MPESKGPLPQRTPARLPEELAVFVRDAAQSVFGKDAVVRSFGEDVSRLEIHVECSCKPASALAELIGQLLTRLDHMPSIAMTRRGTRVSGKARIAYRDGLIL
jgi:hypothetical protein